jgi:hypothetical protein
MAVASEGTDGLSYLMPVCRQFHIDRLVLCRGRIEPQRVLRTIGFAGSIQRIKLLRKCLTCSFLPLRCVEVAGWLTMSPNNGKWIARRTALRTRTMSVYPITMSVYRILVTARTSIVYLRSIAHCTQFSDECGSGMSQCITVNDLIRRSDVLNLDTACLPRRA